MSWTVPPFPKTRGDAETDPGVHLALATDRDEDIPTHVIVRVVHEDGSAFRWPMNASETRHFAAGLLDCADAIDTALHRDDSR